MPRSRMLLLALPLLISSNAWADLKTFDVDPQYRQEVYSALKGVLNPQGQETHGRVELLPSGEILVNASAETLDQVENVLEAMRARPVPAAPRLLLRYWAVLGTRTQNTPAESPIVTFGPNNAGAPVGSPPPAVLNDVLAELTRLHGELTFRVIGTAAVATNSGQFGEVRGTPLSVEHTAHVQGDTLNAEISMELSSSAGLPIGNTVRTGSVSLRTTLEHGEFIALGESHFREPVTGLEGPVFYIVHWEE